MKQILVAGGPAGVRLLSSAVSGQADIESAASLDAAVDRAHAHPDVIACEMSFDDSRMFELVEALKADADMRDIPVVCFRTKVGTLPAAFVSRATLALQALGVAAFIDVVQLSAQVGADSAVAQLGQAISRYL
ncbi:MAG TPA: hypothetical protein VIE63_01900 [Ramlibacter sp.]